jgi:hypothetical protein
LPDLHDPAYAFKAAQLRRRVDLGKRPLTVLILGSSRTLFGLRAGLLEDQLRQALARPVAAYNFGIGGAGPLRECLYLERLLAEGVRPDLVLVEVLPPFLAGQLRRPMELRYVTPTYFKDDEAARLADCGFGLPGLGTFRWQARVVPWYAYRFTLLNRFAAGWLAPGQREYRPEHIDDWGWVPWPFNHPTPDERRRGTEHARGPFMKPLADFQIGPAPCMALRELLTVCQSRGIAAALVLMPEGRAFRSLYPAPAWEQIETFLTGLGREFGVPLVNARRWNGERDFQDSHHLLPEGAARFSTRLGTDFVVPYLLARGRGGQEAGVPLPSAGPATGAQVVP